MTSPIYAGAPAAQPVESAGPTPTALASAQNADEPDDDPPLPAVRQSNGAAPLPVVPLQRTRGSALATLRARALRRCGAGRRATTVRVTWDSADRPVQLQVRRPGRWRTLTAAARGSSARVPAPCGRVTRLRARTRPRGLAAGPWHRVSVRPR